MVPEKSWVLYDHEISPQSLASVFMADSLFERWLEQLEANAISGKSQSAGLSLNRIRHNAMNNTTLSYNKWIIMMFVFYLQREKHILAKNEKFGSCASSFDIN